MGLAEHLGRNPVFTHTQQEYVIPFLFTLVSVSSHLTVTVLLQPLSSGSPPLLLWECEPIFEAGEMIVDLAPARRCGRWTVHACAKGLLDLRASGGVIACGSPTCYNELEQGLVLLSEAIHIMGLCLCRKRTENAGHNGHASPLRLGVGISHTQHLQWRETDGLLSRGHGEEGLYVNRLKWRNVLH